MRRSFRVFGRSWWAEANRLAKGGGFIDEVSLMVEQDEGEEGGAEHAELPFRWFEVGGRAAMRAEFFDESLWGIARVLDVIEWLAVEVPRDGREHTIAVEDFCAKLLELGFEDDTEGEVPADLAGTPAARTVTLVLRGDELEALVRFTERVAPGATAPSGGLSELGNAVAKLRAAASP